MAVTANQLIHRREGQKESLPAAASTRIYQGTLVFANATGYGDDDTATGANKFAGVAVGEVDNSSGSAGDLQVEVWRDGVFKLTGAGTFTQADVGKDVYANDNYAIVLTPVAASVRIGKVARYVSATELEVQIFPSLSGPATAIGYTTGSGGAVTQITSITTGVTLSKATGQITTVASTLAAAGEATFTVTNTLVEATDVVVCSTTYAGAGTPIVFCSKVAAGSFDITISNLHAANALDALLVINFTVIKGKAA